jgi:2-polyprenyl-6-methoxyphenol hydroxylase-like FAD-dependent oxidoreductase
VGAYGYDGHRVEIHEVIYDYAISIGVEIHFNHRVDGYFEDGEKGNAGGIVKGEEFEADLIITADGVESQAKH